MGCERLRTAMLVLALALVAACNASYPFPSSRPVPTALQVHFPVPMGPALVGQSFRLMAYIIDSDGAFEDVTSKARWVSSNAAVVQEAATPPQFVALAPGLADLSATYQGISNAVTITVIEADRQFPILTITPGNPRVVGRSETASALLRASATQSQNVTSQAIWRSSDPNVVSVALAPSGSVAAVRGVSAGTAIITATVDGVSASYSLSILP